MRAATGDRAPRRCLCIGRLWRQRDDEVQAKLQQFAHAVAERKPVTLCRQVLAPALARRLTVVVAGIATLTPAAPINPSARP